MKTLNFLFVVAFAVVAILVINITGIQACTPYENCVRTMNSTVVQTASFNGNQGTYAIPYNMSNGTLVASLLDLPAKELIFTFNATGDGKLTVELPRKTIDSTRDGKDKPYLVFVGNSETDPKRIKANEIQIDNETRTLVIDFTNGDNEIGIVGTFFIENNSTSTGWNPFGAFTPLQQYKKGFDAQDIVCKQDLQLVIKAEDETPACVKLDTAKKLITRGWGTHVTFNSTQKQFPVILPSQPNKIAGLENDAGIVTLGNKTYYFETPNTETASVNPMQISFFHDVVFTFPQSFGAAFLIDGCERNDYWTDAKFSDGTSELLHIYVDSQPCSVHFPSTYFSTHVNPQAGLTFYDGKMKLLVSTNVTNSTEEHNTLTQSLDQTKSIANETDHSTRKLTVHNSGGSGSIHIGSDKFNQTVFFSGNVGQVKTGLPVQVSISDPYDMFVRKYTVLPSDIAQDGSFNFTHTFLGKYDQDVYTLDFSYGTQRYELKYYPIVPP